MEIDLRNLLERLVLSIERIERHVTRKSDSITSPRALLSGFEVASRLRPFRKKGERGFADIKREATYFQKGTPVAVDPLQFPWECLKLDSKAKKTLEACLARYADAMKQ